MTQQEIFDKVYAHLLKQMAKSKPEGETYNRCAYYGEFGRQCAAGIFLKPEVAIQFNCFPISGVPDEFFIDPSVKKEFRLLTELQSVHDSYEPEQWKEKLVGVATMFNLKVPA